MAAPLILGLWYVPPIPSPALQQTQIKESASLNLDSSSVNSAYGTLETLEN